MFVPVVDGRLEFSFELGSGPAQITTTVRVDDGSRHRVVVRRTAREGSLELDGVFHETGKSAGGVHQLLNTKGNIFIGNHLFCLFRQIIFGICVLEREMIPILLHCRRITRYGPDDSRPLHSRLQGLHPQPEDSGFRRCELPAGGPIFRQCRPVFQV